VSLTHFLFYSDYVEKNRCYLIEDKIFIFKQKYRKGDIISIDYKRSLIRWVIE
jgi:hypothetical protein